MSRLKIFLSRLRGLFLKRNQEQELADEIQSHLEMQIEDNLRKGMSPDEARYAALRKFGGVDQVKEVYRDRRSLPFVETFLRDLSYGGRMLRRSPIVTSVAILSLALGIGANTALFSVVDAVLLKTLPVEAPERLVVFEWQSARSFRTSGMSGTSNVDVPPGMRGLSLFRYEVFERMRQARVAAGSESPLSDLFAFGPISEVTAKVGDEAEIIKGQAVSADCWTRSAAESGSRDHGKRRPAKRSPGCCAQQPFLARAIQCESRCYRPTAHTEQTVVYYHWRYSFRVHRHLASELSTRHYYSLSCRTVADG
jgi:hypothetical protein